MEREPSELGRVRQRCAHCHELIGVYEPMMLGPPGRERETSLAREPEAMGTDQPCFHRDCFANSRALEA